MFGGLGVLLALLLNKGLKVLVGADDRRVRLIGFGWLLLCLGDLALIYVLSGILSGAL